MQNPRCENAYFVRRLLLVYDADVQLKTTVDGVGLRALIALERFLAGMGPFVHNQATGVATSIMAHLAGVILLYVLLVGASDVIFQRVLGTVALTAHLKLPKSHCF